MQRKRNIISTVLFTILCQIVTPLQAQLGISFDIKKPRQFDDRVLGSEKSEQKKFTLPRRLTQNTFTHYNYYFNANNKLNEIVEQAKALHEDDYTELLTFYNYTLDATAQNKSQLDSVIYKSTTGIVLHDLRNDWIDNMYLLMGAAYYLRKQFDSAYLTFQFINYAFADKEKDGYYKNIGSSLDGNNVFSIASKEKNSLPRKIFSDPPSRNDAFIWQARTLIAQEEYAEAASLIVTLKSDPVFPKRLRNDLEEVQAWWFYRNNMHDSAALHLSLALDNAPTKKEKARWEFLTAQLYELSGKPEMARKFYEKVISHTTDPVMEIYARLQSIRINKEGGDNYIERNIAELLKMAKRDRYIDYRDVIYYTVAQMEIERGKYAAAQNYLDKSALFNTENTALHNKTYLQLAEIAFAEKKYRLAFNRYDSLKLDDPSLKNQEQLRIRKDMLGKIATQIEITERQDSLQRIAGMNEEERKDFVKKMVRQLRKWQGLKDEAPQTVAATATPSTDLFSASAAKGEWYFYNTALRTKGAGEFKSRWGNRPNVDNWRRSSGMNFTQTSKPLTGNDNNGVAAAQSGEITYDALYDNLPLTDEQLKKSNDSISNALYTLGKALAEEVEDCSSSIKTFEELLDRFPSYSKTDEALFTLYYCYKKTGDIARADAVQKTMKEKFPSNPLTNIVTTGKDPLDNTSNSEATLAYNRIYDLFIEGNFDQALAEKKTADEKYGSHHWTPQLLYIEAIYYIRQRQDDQALAVLVKITDKYSGTPIASRATNMIEVLGRRQQIEEELRNLTVIRPAEDAPKKQDTLVATQPVKEVIKQPVAQPVTNNPVVMPKADSIISKPVIAPFVFKAEDKHFVMLLLNRVDPVWGNEAKNAFNIYNRNTYYNKLFDISLVEISGEYKTLLIGNFDNAQAAAEYVRSARPIAASQIIPWLKGDKYTFSVISAANLEILKQHKDVNVYRQFIEKNLKF
jgi:tetratricopeptide (TPR) repeat protein